MANQSKRNPKLASAFSLISTIERVKPVPIDNVLTICILMYLNLDKLSRQKMRREGLSDSSKDPSPLQFTTAILMGVSVSKGLLSKKTTKQRGEKLLKICENAYLAFNSAHNTSLKKKRVHIKFEPDQYRACRDFVHAFTDVIKTISMGTLLDATYDAERALAIGGLKL